MHVFQALQVPQKGHPQLLTGWQAQGRPRCWLTCLPRVLQVRPLSSPQINHLPSILNRGSLLSQDDGGRQVSSDRCV